MGGFTADRRTSLYVYNKIDSVSLDFLDKLAREPQTVVMSCELDLGIMDVVERCWEELQLMRIYTKRHALLRLLRRGIVSPVSRGATDTDLGRGRSLTSAKP